MPSRNASASQYRYGFQGQEKDDQIKGNGNSINYKYRMHDPRIGRFFSLDPLEANFAFNSPYAFSENRVIDAIELEGAESQVIIVEEIMVPGSGYHEVKVEKVDWRELAKQSEENGGLGTGTLVIHNHYDENGDYVNTSSYYNESFSDYFTEPGGLLVYGSAGSSEDSPGRKIDGMPWGSIDFEALSEVFSVISTATKSMKENSLKKKATVDGFVKIPLKYKDQLPDYSEESTEKTYNPDSSYVFKTIIKKERKDGKTNYDVRTIAVEIENTDTLFDSNKNQEKR